jgi:hypothetical protein
LRRVFYDERPFAGSPSEKPGSEGEA